MMIMVMMIMMIRFRTHFPVYNKPSGVLFQVVLTILEFRQAFS